MKYDVVLRYYFLLLYLERIHITSVDLLNTHRFDWIDDGQLMCLAVNVLCWEVWCVFRV